MKLYSYWVEWYTIFTRLPKKNDYIMRSSRNVEVTEEFATKYLTVKKEFESLTKQLIRKFELQQQEEDLKRNS